MPKTNQAKDKRIGTLWEPVEASPEEIARVCMEGPPKKPFDYEKRKRVYCKYCYKNVRPDTDGEFVMCAECGARLQPMAG